MAGSAVAPKNPGPDPAALEEKGLKCNPSLPHICLSTRSPLPPQPFATNFSHSHLFSSEFFKFTSCGGHGGLDPFLVPFQPLQLLKFLQLLLAYLGPLYPFSVPVNRVTDHTYCSTEPHDYYLQNLPHHLFPARLFGRLLFCRLLPNWFYTLECFLKLFHDFSIQLDVHLRYIHISAERRGNNYLYRGRRRAVTHQEHGDLDLWSRPVV